MSVDIVAMGFLFNEKIIWPDGRVQGPVLGATASYGSVALGGLGANAGLVSIVGEDTSRELLKPVLECGIDLKGLEFRKGASETCNLLEYFADGTKELTYLKVSPLIMFEDIPEEYLDAKVFHLCLVDYEVPVETIRKIRERNPKALITADLGGVGGAHSREATRNRYLDTDGGIMQKEYLKEIDIGKISVEDAEKAFRCTFATPEDAAKAYIDAGVGMVVCTLGGGGTYVVDKNGKEVRINAVTPFNGVLDTTGAGDTYIASFVYGYLKFDGDVEKAAYYASASSSLIIEKTGGVQLERMPTSAMVEERLEKFFAQK